MFLQKVQLDRNATVADIVNSDYRTADVFRKYGIEYCCGGKYPLHIACIASGADEGKVIKELEEAVREMNTSNTLNFADWHIDFLTDYIVNVHHEYLRNALPQLQDYIDRFADGHRKKYYYLDELQQSVRQLSRNFIPHLKHEEEIIFPYIRQIGHAYYSRETYASLLVRTLRKPVEEIMASEHQATATALNRMREITTNYSAPESACISHKVTFAKLREVDADLTQHIYLENNILFPKAIAMEKELLLFKD
jgi:regulator of cell morphogenesis and NO signaling